MRDELRVRLSKGLVLDLRSPAALDDGFRCFISGESGSGKSSATALVIEQVLMKGAQVVVLDPHGEFGDLTGISPDTITKMGYGGSGHFWGEKAYSEPVDRDSIEECLDIVEKGDSLLVDLKHWALMPRERDVFTLGFIKALFQLRVCKPKFTLLVLEEAAAFAPQSQMAGQAENVLVVTTVITDGRKFGLQTLLTTQQPSLVDSRVLKGCNIRVFMRTTDFGDYKKLKPYLPTELGITFTGEPTSTITHPLGSIQKLKSGEAVIISRWVPNARVRLLQPQTVLRKAAL